MRIGRVDLTRRPARMKNRRVDLTKERVDVKGGVFRPAKVPCGPDDWAYGPLKRAHRRLGPTRKPEKEGTGAKEEGLRPEKMSRGPVESSRGLLVPAAGVLNILPQRTQPPSGLGSKNMRCIRHEPTKPSKIPTKYPRPAAFYVGQSSLLRLHSLH